ncbi:MAG: hypothetical protein ACE14O_07165 [Candidatus Cloacimonadaceae bacterium]
MDEEQYYYQQTSEPQIKHANNVAPVMTIGDWIVTILLMCIPIVNVVLLIVWAVSNTDNPNRKNWALAILIFIGIFALIMIFLAGSILGILGGFANAFS